MLKTRIWPDFTGNEKPKQSTYDVAEKQDKYKFPNVDVSLVFDSSNARAKLPLPREVGVYRSFSSRPAWENS